MCGSKPYCSCGCEPKKVAVIGQASLGRKIAQLLGAEAITQNDVALTANSLGLTASTKRAIKPGYEYDKYFAPALGEPVELGSGNQKKTLKLMRDWVKKHQGQSKKIAEQLKRKNLVNTLSAIWHFLYEHVQYELDQDGVEQLRTPNRVWADRFKGVDCDCYSIFISSVLHNLGIPHAFRMTKYSGDWQHVYVVVPKDGTEQGLQHRPDYFVIDPVADRFNYEHQFSAKHDLFMNIRIQGLQGFGNACETKSTLPTDYKLDYVPISELALEGMLSTEQVLQKSNIPYQVNRTADQTMLEVAYGGNFLQLPTTITPTEAQTITQAAEIAASENPEVAKKASMGKGWILALLLIGGGIYLMGSNKPVNKSKSKSNLSGAPKRKQKRKTVRRKKTPITI